MRFLCVLRIHSIFSETVSRAHSECGELIKLSLGHILVRNLAEAINGHCSCTVARMTRPVNNGVVANKHMIGINLWNTYTTTLYL